MDVSSGRFFEIEEYHRFISAPLAKALLSHARPFDGIPGLLEIDQGGGLETRESLNFLVDLYLALKDDLRQTLRQRTKDRKFLDERVKAFVQCNAHLKKDFLSSDYETIIGLQDAHGRVVMGPKSPNYCLPGGQPVADIPDFLKGPHVTLFGPPDSAKMAINAMNAYHRKLPDEPPIISELLKSQKSPPKWGADDEDSKTPLRAALVDAAQNLTACFEHTLFFQENLKTYSLEKEHLSIPIKRFPGLAIPCHFLFFEENPIPLHLYDFALHFFRNWNNPQALTFYVPKLENEEEARYIHKMISLAERRIQKQHPEYQLGTVRVMIVLENPRAILRTHEIMDALYPYFVGASLGWHDYLASTARIFKEEPNYRIPVKADPEIVIKYIKASHRMLADVVGSRGGIKVGGMYGILPLTNDLSSESFQMTVKGFFKDVIIQLKRDLTGFWVAHPDFVRLGLALVEAWKFRKAGDPEPLKTLMTSLLKPQFHGEILDFLEDPDKEGLDPKDPGYVRSLIVADIKESDFIPNNDPEEIRYNVFQSLQYLTDWLCGNGCVALPALVNDVPVRVMDDLATAERSRWEVWHEIHHGRFSLDDFIKIAHEELHFIRKDLSNEKKIVQVKWNENTKKWYPVALRIMIKLMTDSEPPEFASELLLPFTWESLRQAEDPLSSLSTIDPHHLSLEKSVERLHRYFEVCGALRFAQEMATLPVQDLHQVRRCILSFTIDEVNEAAFFHGNIGETPKTLDSMAAKEQALVLGEKNELREELQKLGEKYISQFGFKFLISAKDKTGSEILEILKRRLAHSPEEELNNAREALWEITKKRLTENPLDSLKGKIQNFLTEFKIPGASIAINESDHTQVLSFGKADSNTPVSKNTRFQLASLSKPIGALFAAEYFKSREIPLDTPVNRIFERTHSPFRLSSSDSEGWIEKVTLNHLMSHCALNLHYVNGFKDFPNSVGEILMNPDTFGYDPIQVVSEPGVTFRYSGGGFLVLEHLIESLEEKPIQDIFEPFLEKLHIPSLLPSLDFENHASGFFDSGEAVPSGHLKFPLFAAGLSGTAKDTAHFLNLLTKAFQNLDGASGISHDTAVEMLYGTDKGCRTFMGCLMGRGIFVAEAGPNKFALHQGANEGFRSLFLQCYDGPDQGFGLVIFANADHHGVLFIAAAAREILTTLKVQGFDFGKVQPSFDFSKISHEQIVNQGYKNLLFQAFEPNVPEAIETRGPKDELSDFNLAVNGTLLRISNQKFARGENLLSPFRPVFDPELFGAQGKIMDSWETARHNQNGMDFLEFSFKNPQAINFVRISTQFHDGNHVEHLRLLGRKKPKEDWKEFLPKTQLLGHSELKIRLPKSTEEFCQIRVEVFPDGGLTRLGLFSTLPEKQAQGFHLPEKAKCVRFSEEIPKSFKPLTLKYSGTTDREGPDLACLAFGGTLESATNEHYGPAAQVISPYPPIHMFDGLESVRSREPGHHEEVILRLAKPVLSGRLVLDFRYFINNNPLEIRVQGFIEETWMDLSPRIPVKAFAGNLKEIVLNSETEFQKLKIQIYPDGGINRIHFL